jgi:hypothetical protein
MYTISKPCPRCGHDKSIMSIVWADGPFNDREFMDRETLGRCIHCAEHTIILVRTFGHVALAGQNTGRGDIDQMQDIHYIGMIPRHFETQAPDDVPEKVGKAYVEGMTILSKKMWTPAAGSFRTSLDRATQILWAQHGFEEAMPFKLDVRLKKLAAKLSIPQSMMDWADTVRVVGNEMHEVDDVSAEDAADAGHFVETFLTYMFTLPARVARFKARREAE